MEEECVDDPLPIAAIVQPENVPSTFSQPSIAGPQPTQAVIWTYFSRISTREAKCNICKYILKTPAGTTSPLIRHLENKHKIEYKSYIEKQKLSLALKQEKLKSKMPTASKQSKIDNHFKSTDKWASSHPRAQTITKAIGKWMAKSFHPYSLVEEDGFKDLMDLLEPKYNIPSRTTFSRAVMPELYDDTKRRVAAEIKNNANDLKSLAITTDLWTSASNDAFISVTGHYIDEDFNIKTCCFGNSYFPEEHNGLNIASKLQDMMNEWGLQHTTTMPIYCITDNAPNMVNAINLTPWFHLRCFAHTLQLALSDAKKEIQGMLAMLSKARAIVGHYKHSSAAQGRLNRIQEQLGKTPLQLIQDCETRWNSEYSMLSRLVALKQAVSAELSTTVKPHNLTSSEWELAEGYIYILKPLDDATTLSSSAFLPTLSTVLPLIDGVKTVIKKFIASGNKGVMFARALFKALNLRFPSDQYHMSKHYLLSMLVDPRYKSLILDDVTKRVAIDLLEREMVMFHKESEADPAVPTTQSTSGQPKDVTSQTQTEEQFSLWHHLQSLSQKSLSDSSTEDLVSNQIKTYLNVPTILMSENPYEWWKKNGLYYKFMIPVVRRYLGIPATEVPSERVFSSAGNVVNVRRRNLTQEHVSELVFLHHNL